MFWRRSSQSSLEMEKEVPSSVLWDLVLDMNWDGVVERCRTHPIDAEYLDGHWEETPLYLVCQQDPPPEVVKEIIKAYPEAVLARSRANKDLPLHIASRYQSSVSLLEALLHDFPDTATQQTKFGVLPLNALWEFRPEGAAADENFWKKVLIIISAVARSRLAATLSKSNDLQPREDDVDAEKFLVHATVSLGGLSCPIEVLNFVLEKYPKQVFERDRSGQLPLHIAVGPTSWSQATKRKYKPREREIVSTLLCAYPKAANAPLPLNRNRLPLQIALTNRHTWSGGIEDLLQAAPEILLKQDPETKLFPFQLASIPVRDTEVELDTIFHLLRRQPDVLRLFKLQKKGSLKTISNRICPWKSRDVQHEAILAGFAAAFIGCSVCFFLTGH